MRNFLFGTIFKFTKKRYKNKYKECPSTFYPDAIVFNILPHLVSDLLVCLPISASFFLNHLRKSCIYHGDFTPNALVCISYGWEYSISKHSTVISLSTFNIDTVLFIKSGLHISVFQQTKNTFLKAVFFSSIGFSLGSHNTFCCHDSLVSFNLEHFYSHLLSFMTLTLKEYIVL